MASRWKFDPCPECCTPGVTCNACDGPAATRLAVTLAGIAQAPGGTCALAAAFNAAYAVDYQGDFNGDTCSLGPGYVCAWRYLFPSPMCSVNSLWLYAQKYTSGWAWAYRWGVFLATSTAWPTISTMRVATWRNWDTRRDLLDCQTPSVVLNGLGVWTLFGTQGTATVAAP